MPISKPHRILSVALAFALAALGGVAVTVLAQDAPQAVLDKMQRMMENRPAAMKDAEAAIDAQKRQAAGGGNYVCCLRHPCDFCALNMGQCPCGKNVADGKPVCSECKGGWHAGDGAIPGVSADEVKTLPRSGL